jgi:hypothetical protein
MRNSGTLVLALVISATVLSPASAAAIYDVVTDFSVGSNPNGTWSYGYLDTPAGLNYTLMSFGTSGAGIAGVDAWSAAVDYPQATATPYIARNTTASEVQNAGGDFRIPVDELQMHPGIHNEAATIRWTAPTDMVIDFSGFFEGLDLSTKGTTTDVHVLLNDVALFDANVTGNGVGTRQPFAFTGIRVAAGTVVDFVVGYGTDDNYFSDSTGLSASITRTEAPEPAALTFVTLGLAVVVRKVRPRY